MNTKNRSTYLALAAALLLAAGARAAAEPQVPAPAFAQQPLSYAADALEPYISSETVQYHYGKHYKANVDALNKLTAGKPEAAMPLELLLMTAPPGPLFNNAAQAWNHAFYLAASGPAAAANQPGRWRRPSSGSSVPSPNPGRPTRRPRRTCSVPAGPGWCWTAASC